MANGPASAQGQVEDSDARQRTWGVPGFSLTDMLRAMGDLILLRHGETEWSKEGKHTGRTDVPLTTRSAMPPPRRWLQLLIQRDIVAVFTSPAQRAVRTADLAGLADAKPDPDLWEWDYGGYEGLTTREIQEQRPGWYLWRDGVIPGDAAHPGETVGAGGRAGGPGAAPGRAAAGPTATSRWSRTATSCAYSPPATCGLSRLPGDASGWTPGRLAPSATSTASRSSCPGTCRPCLSRRSGRRSRSSVRCRRSGWLRPPGPAGRRGR